MALDIIFMIIFCWAAYKGFTKGFLVQAAALIALVLGIWGAVRFSDFTASLIMEKMAVNTQYLPLIAFALTFIAIVVGVHFLAKLIEKLLEMIALSFVNRILGVLFNLLKFAFIISAVLVIVNTINRKANIIPPEKLTESKLYRPLSALAPMIFPYLHFDFTHPLNAPDAPSDPDQQQQPQEEESDGLLVNLLPR